MSDVLEEEMNDDEIVLFPAEAKFKMNAKELFYLSSHTPGLHIRMFPSLSLLRESCRPQDQL